MKTTVEIAEDLLRRARKLARDEGTTLKAIFEEGLRLSLKARAKKPRCTFEMPTFAGDGRTDEFRDAPWERIRDEIYRDRG